jgi:hypothetical protein
MIDAASVEDTEHVEREREALNRHLEDILAWIRNARRRGATAQEVDEVEVAVGKARLRMIAFARMTDGAERARIMRPDPSNAYNVVGFRRRVRW